MEKLEEDLNKMDSKAIIGGADGPTSVFLAGELGANWINIYGFILVASLLIPNIIYAVKTKEQKNKCRYTNNKNRLNFLFYHRLKVQELFLFRRTP